MGWSEGRDETAMSNPYLFVRSLTQVTLGGEESDYIDPAGKFEGESTNVGDLVTLHGKECVVTEWQGEGYKLKFRYPPFTLTADMVEIDLSGCGVRPPEAALTAAFMKEKCG